MANHSPGPWEALMDHGEWYINDNHNGLVCMNIQEKADADLIAAAPEMYEALKEMYEYMVDRFKGSNFRPMLSGAKIALEKAEGK